MSYEYGLGGLCGDPSTSSYNLDYLVDLLSEGGGKAKKLLKDGFDINTANDSDGCTALELATMKGNYRVVASLIDKGAAINGSSSDEPVSTALHHAVKGTWKDIVELLLEKGAIIDEEDLENGSLLNMALCSDNKNLFQGVFDYYGSEIDYYEDISKVGDEGINASIVKSFLKSDCTEVRLCDRQFLLHSSANDGYVQMAKLLLRPGTIKTGRYWITSIQAYICQKENKIVEALLFREDLENPIDLMSEMSKDELGMVLFVALEMRNEDVVTFLKGKTTINEQMYNEILHPAIETEDEEYLKWILNLKFQVEKGENKLYRHCLPKSPLHWAVEKGNCNIIELLLSSGADIDTEKFSEVDALLYAARKNQEAVVKLFLGRGADINSMEIGTGKTALLIAIEGGHENIVKLLFDKGASIQDADRTGKTPLHMACQVGNENLVKLLLEMGANIQDRDREGKTPLQLVAGNNNDNIIKLLLPIESTVSQMDEKVIDDGLHYACRTGNEELFKMLFQVKLKLLNKLHIENGLLSIMDGKAIDNALDAACKIGHEYYFKMMLPVRLKLDEINGENLDYCAQTKNKYFGKWLSYNAKTSDGLTVLHSAVIGGNLNIVNRLLEYNWEVDVENYPVKSALYYAASQEKAEIVKLLLRRAGVKNNQDALFGAAEGGHVNLIKSLITDYELSVDCKDSDNQSVLYKAVQKRQVKVVKCLLGCGADINARRKEYTKTYYGSNGGYEKIFKGYSIEPAIENKDGKLVKILLDHAISLEEANVFDMTVLYKALEKYKNYQIVEQLLEYGAFVGATDENKLKALQTTIKERDSETLQLLFDYQLNITNRNTVEKAIERDRSGISSKIVTRHIVKMITQNLHVPENNLRVIDNNDKLRNFKKKCELEIEQMKSEVLENSTVSLYDILISTDLNQLLAFAQNTSILKAVSCWKCKVNFPIYHCVLNNQLKKGVWRKQLLTSVQGFFKAVAKAEGNEDLPILPVLCAAGIFSYLSNKDFKVLMRVCNVNLDDYDICNVTIV